MKRLLCALLCLLFLLSIVPVPAAAEGDAPVLVTSVTLSPPENEDATLTAGEALSLHAAVMPTEATDASLTWASGNADCATVDETGRVTAVAAGTATITATANDGSGVFGTMEITVVAAPVAPPESPVSSDPILVTGVTVSAANGASSVAVGSALQFSAAVTPADATNPAVVWSVVNGAGTASIDSHGLLTPGTPGGVTVTAAASDGSGIVGSYPLEILAPVATIPVTAITVVPAGSASSVAANATLQFSATVAPADATHPTVVWSVVNGAGTATIDSHGLLTPGTPGDVTVTAAASDGSGIVGSYPLEILAPVATIPVTAITVAPADGATSVAANATLQFSATVEPADATDPTVVWSVVNGAGTARVDANGLVTGVTVGDVAVTATANDGSGVSGSFTLTVGALTGAGTAEAPYQIGAVEDLTLLAQLINGGNAAFASAHYQLTAALDLSRTAWTPIGTAASPFTGTFDGQGKAIEGLSGGGSGSGYYGLFAVTSGATLQNIVMEKVSFALGGSYAGAGAIVGHMTGGTLQNSYAAGKIETTFTSGATGGLVGVLTGGAITDCMNVATVLAAQNAGGIVGQADARSTIATSYGSGSVDVTDGSGTFGTIVAQPSDGLTMQNCYCVEGGDPLATHVPWRESSSTESYAGFAFGSVWEMGSGEYYSLPVLKSSPFAGDASWVHTEIERGFGYLPSDEKVPGLVSRKRLRSVAAPASYITPNLPPVRDQGSYGTCWAHAALAAAEISRIKAGEPSTINYAETQLVWAHYLGYKNGDNNYNDPLNNFGGDRTFLGNYTNPYDLDGPWQIGGKDIMTARTLAGWLGVTQEDSSTVYDDARIAAITANGLPYEYAFEKDVAHLTDMQMIPWSEGEAVIKQAIMNYGAVTISYAHYYQFFSGFSKYYYKSAASYQNASYYTNHAVTIVGWDDSISANYFSDTLDPNNTRKPSRNGAWIVRNSWGPDFNNWGDNGPIPNGYFYMSYETKDNTDENDAVTFWQFSSNDKYDRCYQYDGSASGTYESITDDTGKTIANVFTATKNEALEAVSFWLQSASTPYTIKVYKNVSSQTDPTVGELVETITGTTAYAGYYTKALSTPAFIEKNSRFSIVITFTRNGTYLDIPFDRSYSYYYSYAKKGQSYYLYGTYWMDLNEGNTGNAAGANYRIKAFTSDKIPVDSITVTGAGGKTEVEKDDTLQMSAAILPTSATHQDVKWSVTPGTGAATIDEDSGLLTGQTEGTVTVVATAQDGVGKTGQLVIRITPKKVKSITVIVPNYLEIGASVTCDKTITPGDAANPTIKWSVTPGTGSATINETTGELSDITVGTITIKAAAQDGSNVIGEKSVTIVAVDSLHTITVDVSETSINPSAELYIDGVVYREADGGLDVTGTATAPVYSTEIPKTTASTAVVYAFNDETAAADPHKVYPTEMAVWELTYDETGSAYTAERKIEFDNLLGYMGSSIRISGTKGIRLITSVPTSTRNTLINAEVDGYHLEEYGTLLAWTSNITDVNPLVLGSANVKSNYAYKRGVADPIFAKGTDRISGDPIIMYTNVLVNLDLEDCIPNISMRPYIILKDDAGNERILYGGIVVRTIGYIAWQNRAAFSRGTAAYNYIWSIINYVQDHGEEFE